MFKNGSNENQKPIIASIITELRESNNLKQKDVAEFLHVTVSAVSHYEQGITAPSTEIIVKLADYYNVSTDYILCRCQNKVDYTKLVDIKLNRNTTIGDAIKIMSSASKSDKEFLVYALNLIDKSKDN